MQSIDTKRAALLISAFLVFTLAHGATAGDKPKEKAKPVINLENGLVSEWRGNGNPIDSVGGNNGVPHGIVSYSGMGDGQGFLFDGGDAGLNVPDADNLKITKSLTISAWIDIYGYPAPDKLWGEILMRADDRNGLDPYFFAVSPDKKLVFTVEGATESSTVMAPVPLGQSFLATATLDDATGLMRIYANGVVIAEDTATARPFKDLDNNSNPGLGIGYNQGFPKSPYHMAFNGIISDLRVYNRAISQDEVLALYTAGVTLPKPIVKAKLTVPAPAQK